MRKYSYKNLKIILGIVGNVFLLLEKYSNCWIADIQIHEMSLFLIP